MIRLIILSLQLTFLIVNGEISPLNDARGCITPEGAAGKCLPIDYPEKYRPTDPSTMGLPSPAKLTAQSNPNSKLKKTIRFLWLWLTCQLDQSTMSVSNPPNDIRYCLARMGVIGKCVPVNDLHEPDKAHAPELSSRIDEVSPTPSLRIARSEFEDRRTDFARMSGHYPDQPSTAESDGIHSSSDEDQFTGFPRDAESTAVTTQLTEKMHCGRRFFTQFLTPYYSAGGRVVTYEYAWPWMAGLFEVNKHRDSSDSYRHKCGGSIISENFILTAAHCVEEFTGRKVSNLIAGVGSVVVNETVKIPIKEIIIHPNYEFHQRYNDIALVITSAPMKYSPTIRPICLPEPSLDSIVTESSSNNLKVAGWGIHNADGQSSLSVLEVDLDLRSNEKCNRSYSESSSLPRGILSTQICAEASANNEDSCSGDSGEPLTIRVPGKDEESATDYLIGIFSHEEECKPGSPGVFTRVSEYVPWIEEQLKTPF